MNLALASIVALSFLTLSTPAEAGRHDQRQQKRIHRAEKRAESDGKVTGKERAKLEAMQDKSSQNIYRMKQNEKQQGDSGATTPVDPAAAPALPVEDISTSAQ